MLLFFSESGYGYYYRFGKRGMKKIASRQRANKVHAELSDYSRRDYLKEILAEVESNKAQLKATH